MGLLVLLGLRVVAGPVDFQLLPTGLLGGGELVEGLVALPAAAGFECGLDLG